MQDEEDDVQGEEVPLDSASFLLGWSDPESDASDDEDGEEELAALGPRTSVAMPLSPHGSSMFSLFQGMSFIDLRDDPKPEVRRKPRSHHNVRNWRHFVEIAGPC